ncbi:MAG: hypothetical protein KDJ65_16780 [Anaerolineae bacterium]|nr:hypothetical protein [Anaerolineae bacterium]
MNSTKLYYIEVRQQGCFIACHLVEAGDALTAINRVESLYGEPVVICQGTLEDKKGGYHKIILPTNWHGYTFEAWVVESISSSSIDKDIDEETSTKQRLRVA